MKFITVIILLVFGTCVAVAVGNDSLVKTSVLPPGFPAQSNENSRKITCWPQFTPDQLVRSFEPEVVNCYGYLYEDTIEVLQTMCVAIWRQSGKVIQDYESLAESVCPLWNKRGQCLWKFISARCTPAEFAIIAEIRRTTLIAVAKEALCNDTIRSRMYKFLELGGDICFCSTTTEHAISSASEFINSLLECFDFYRDFPLAGIPYETFKSFLEKAKTCGSPLVQKCLAGSNSSESSQEIGKAYVDFIDALALAQVSLWSYRAVN